MALITAVILMRKWTVYLKRPETEDKSERLQLYNEFQDEFAADPPYTLIAYIDSIYVPKNNINGITESTLLGHHGVGIFWNVYDWEIQQID